MRGPLSIAPLVLPTLAALLIPSLARASERPSAWSYGVNVGDQGESGAELWIGDTTPELDHARATHAWNSWLGLTSTLTDRLELAVYGIVAEGPTSPLGLVRAEGQLRIKVTDWFGVLVAPALTHDAKGAGLASADLQLKLGSLLLLANAGASLNYDYAGNHPVIPASVALGIPITDSLRVNLEGLVRLVTGDDDGSGPAGSLIAEAGPGLSYNQGHFWLALDVALGTEFGELAESGRLAMGLMF